MQMQFFALAAKCARAAGLVPAGSAASNPSPRSSSATASMPIPLAEVARKSRRDWSTDFRSGCMMDSLPRHEFIKIQNRASQRRPGRGLSRCALARQLRGGLGLRLIEGSQLVEELGGPSRLLNARLTTETKLPSEDEPLIPVTGHCRQVLAQCL